MPRLEGTLRQINQCSEMQVLEARSQDCSRHVDATNTHLMPAPRFINDEDYTMQKNISLFERIARVLIGIGLVGATLLGSIGVWGWIGIIPLVTGAVGFCPLYRAVASGARPGSGFIKMLSA
ncbi:YgaP family membrane protein [Delftia acidovorans]|uniref:DUF2892 domain-containing protein n=1 Tax=Delftia acidovorans TaxID=80866 RepID=A0AAJ2R1I5_DELAC|nr:DUF2892 domain-containing protein [Delftia acidovorans]MDX4953613.1 DUF2892 domain-containing protein [Delftia acidovorans]